MKSSTAMFIAMVGLLLTMGGVGGIENSMTNMELGGSLVIAVVGLMVMGCGVAALQVSDYYDQRG